MGTWTAPSEGTWHFGSADDAPPHRFEECDDACHGRRRGWLGWVAKGTAVDRDTDPNGKNPSGAPVL